ncbi:hypothetical protein ACFY4C_40525 [Actinomadura viridis]|uniref:hypothetical protein n=1 Tax=Actinomadura viridis TaxID=58110 RepID=UPI0036A96C99
MLVIVGMGAVPATARADCTGPFGIGGEESEPPIVATPGAGMAGFFDPTPGPTANAPGDPFAPNSGITIYERYGFAGQGWAVYDLGCLGSYKDPMIWVDTNFGNALMGLASAYVALASSLNQAVTSPDFLSTLDPVIRDSTTAIFNGGFLPWAGLSIALLGIWIIGKAAGADLAIVVKAAGWALLVLALVGTVLLYPLAAGKTADDALVSTIGRMNAGFTGKADVADNSRKHTGLVVDALLYRQTLRGWFGDADSTTARTYGPKLFRASALTWRESRLQGKARQKLIETRQKEWKRVAEEVKERDPDAYRHLTGRAKSRVGVGALAAFSAMILCTFELFTSLYIVYALLLVRGAVMLMPVLAIGGLWLSGSSIISGSATFVGRALLTSVMYSAANGISVLLARYTIGSDHLPLWLSLIIYGVGFIVLFFSVRRLRGGNRGGGIGRWILGAVLLYRVRRWLGGH